MCSLCQRDQETIQHLFFDCLYASHIWSWLSSTIGVQLLLSVLEILKVCNGDWSSQCQVVVLASIINAFDSTWFARNQVRFNNKVIPWKTAINLIISKTSLSGLSACGGLFRNSNGDFLGGFSDNLGTASSLFAELMAAILAIEIAYSNRWFNVWLETDSKLVQLAFKSNISVPWKLQNRWQNCIITARKLNLILSYL